MTRSVPIIQDLLISQSLTTSHLQNFCHRRFCHARVPDVFGGHHSAHYKSQVSLSPKEGLGWADTQKDVYQRQVESPFKKPFLSSAHWNLAVPFPFPSHQEEAYRVTAEQAQPKDTQRTTAWLSSGQDQSGLQVSHASRQVPALPSL